MKSCEIYNPITNEWEFTDSLSLARDNHIQILLDNGNVMVVGGRVYDNNSYEIENTSCEMFDITTEKWETIGDLSESRTVPGVFKISENRLLIVGGDAENTWELYDLENNQSIFLEKFPAQQTINNTNSLQLNDQSVIVIGGYEWSVDSGIQVLSPSQRCWSFDITTDINEEEILSSNFKLYQNYPNPFNPSTKISYNIPQNSFVSLVILNSLGEKVRTLVSEYQNDGYYEINFNSENLPSGIYYYRIRTDGLIKTNKMVLIK